MTDWDAIVVGAGFGGLVCAGYLAASGMRVLVIEQHDVAGGNGHVFRRRRAYEFDVGTHYLGDCGADGVLPAILSGLGVGDRVAFHPMDQNGFDRIVTPSVTLDVPADWTLFRERLVNAFPQEAAGVSTFLQICEVLAAADRNRLLNRSGPDTANVDPDVLRWGHRTLGKLFDHCGLSNAARTVLAAQLGNYGTLPSDTLVASHAGMIDGYLRGAYYPAGGGQTIVAALVEALEAQGGALWTKTKVSRILVDDGKVTGVALADGRTERSRLVVSNADYRRTVLELCGGSESFPQPVVRRTADATMRMPMASLYVVLDAEDADRANANIWWWRTEDMQDAFDRFATRGFDDVPFVFLSFASVKDPVAGSACPPGQTNFQIMTLCPPGYRLWGTDTGPADGNRYRRDPEYLAAKDRFTSTLLDLAEQAIGPFRRQIVHLETASPLTQERYTLSTGGSAYGLARWGKTGLRPDVTTQIDGLFLAGQNTRYGGGIVGASASGVVCASAILDRPLMAEVSQGAVLANPALLPDRAPDWDPLRISRGAARQNARGLARISRHTGVARSL
jgi:phytoene dehydrogenase-like protein